MWRLPVWVVVVLAVACVGAPAPGEPRVGPWRAWLDSPGGELPFKLELVSAETGLAAFVHNGSERIAVPRVERCGDELILGIDHYDAEIRATFSNEGRRLDGHWTKTAGSGAKTTLRFHADAGDGPRFVHDAAAEGDFAPVDGRWRVDFAAENDPAVGLFESAVDGTVRGTFLTATGDYRYLAGSYRGGRLRLSCFDGAHAFLFDARMNADGTLVGDFWSRDSWHDTWRATRDDAAQTPDAFAQTRVADGRRLSELTYPDLDGRPRPLDDPALGGPVRLLYVFGSWCPNCNDATAYLTELHQRYGPRGLSVVGLAFELTGDPRRDAAQVRRYLAHHGADYPVLLAGTAEKTEASAALPLLDRVRAFPTTIFVGATGEIRAVHTGFSGPATGSAHTELRKRFEALIEELLAAVSGA